MVKHKEALTKTLPAPDKLALASKCDLDIH